MISNYFGDPVTFLLAPPSRQKFPFTLMFVHDKISWKIFNLISIKIAVDNNGLATLWPDKNIIWTIQKPWITFNDNFFLMSSANIF